MKINFDDKSFLEVVRSSNPGKILISIQAKDYNNPQTKITNSVEITEEQFKQIVSSI